MHGQTNARAGSCIDGGTDRKMNTVNRVLSNGMNRDAGLEPEETRNPIISLKGTQRPDSPRLVPFHLVGR